MDMLLSAVHLLLSVENVIALVGGTLLGVAIGVLPGLGPAVGVSLALPLTLGLGQVAAITMLMGIYAGSIYGGSVTAILINTPGTAASAASCLDGYPMTRKGQSAKALGIAAFASVVGGILSVIVLALFAPRLAGWARHFGPAEMFAMALFALTCIATVSSGNMVKGLLMGVLGLFLAVIGQDVFSGETRFTFGVFELSAGLGLVPVLVGLFALSEVFARLASTAEKMDLKTMPAGFTLPSLSEIRALLPTLSRGSAIGIVLGILPGIGPTTASFVSYAEARRTSKEPESFGKGNPNGLAASECANSAVTGGALVPTLALGVPGDPITAIMLGALIIQEIVPGPRLFAQHGDLVTAIFLSLLLINLLILPMAKGFAEVWRRILVMPEPLLMGLVVVLISVGIYTLNNSVLDLVTAFAAGVAGYALRRANFPLAPIIIGFVLGPMVEQNLRMGLIVYDQDVMRFLARPIPLFLLGVSLLLLCWPLLRRGFSKLVHRKA